MYQFYVIYSIMSDCSPVLIILIVVSIVVVGGLIWNQSRKRQFFTQYKASDIVKSPSVLDLAPPAVADVLSPVVQQSNGRTLPFNDEIMPPEGGPITFDPNDSTIRCSINDTDIDLQVKQKAPAPIENVQFSGWVEGTFTKAN